MALFCAVLWRRSHRRVRSQVRAQSIYYPQLQLLTCCFLVYIDDADLVTMLRWLRADVYAGSVACRLMVDMLVGLAAYWYCFSSQALRCETEISYVARDCKSLWVHVRY